jgi:hypothetical protein
MPPSVSRIQSNYRKLCADKIDHGSAITAGRARYSPHLPGPNASSLTNPQVACSRERVGCHRCKDDDAICNYSRSGVIRRNRKRKKDGPGPPSTVAHELTPDSTPIVTKANETGLPSHLASAISVTRERLDRLENSPQNPLGALSSLSEASATIWHDSSGLEDGRKDFFLFKDQTPSWVNCR